MGLMELFLLWTITIVMFLLLIVAIGVASLLYRKYRGPKYPSTVRARMERKR